MIKFVKKTRRINWKIAKSFSKRLIADKIYNPKEIKQISCEIPPRGEISNHKEKKLVLENS